MNRESVRDVIAAIGIWEDLGSLKTEADLQLLRDYGESLRGLSGRVLSVKVACEPQDAAAVETVTVPA